MNNTPDTDRVLTDIRTERTHQIDLGWTTDHDDKHQTHTLVTLANQYAHKPESGNDQHRGYYSRHRLIQAAALLVAAVEAMDREDRRG